MIFKCIVQRLSGLALLGAMATTADLFGYPLLNEGEFILGTDLRLRA